MGATGAQIVLSSDWRIGRDLRLLKEELEAAGIAGVLIGLTPVLDGAPRWREIQAWIDENRAALEHVAIVDDTFDMGPLAPRFVRASPLNGLDESTAAALVALLAAPASAPAVS